jgi:alkylation response protein AidB-like acyl-CoA dehydrogenase
MSDQKNHQTFSAADPVTAAFELTPLIRAHADETERARRLAAPVVNALRSARLFAMGLPASLGGIEMPIASALKVIEQIA